MQLIRLPRIITLNRLAILGWLIANVSVVFAQTTSDNFQGTWLSSSQKFAISNNGQQLTVRGWGSCQPEWCDWGEVPLSLIAPSVESKAYTHALAVWEKGFQTKYAVITFQKQGLLIELFTVFHDGSGRSNYRSSGLLTPELCTALAFRAPVSLG